jgi:hypothetical protein
MTISHSLTLLDRCSDAEQFFSRWNQRDERLQKSHEL